jgi:hypothetical protein
METFKEILSIVGAIVGLLTSLIPLYARFIDNKRKKTRSESVRHARWRHAVHKHAAVAEAATAVAVEDEPEYFEPSQPRFETPQHLEPGHSQDAHFEPAHLEPEQLLRAKQLVKAPGLALVIAGFLGLAFNVLVAGFGFIDQFVTPLSDQTKMERAKMEKALVAQPSTDPAVLESAVGERDRDQATAVIGIVALMGFSGASGMAVWAGFNMMKLRSYWLSMAGSIAVMPGGFLCCFAGVPVGIWSLVTLLRPEVSSSFS